MKINIKIKTLAIFKGFGKPKLQRLYFVNSTKQSLEKTNVIHQNTNDKKNLKKNLESIYQRQQDISLDNENIVDPFVRYFFYLLSQKFCFQFEAIHNYPMWWAFEYFLRFHPELIDRINFHPSHPVAFNRRYSAIKSQIENDISENKKKFKFFGDQEVLVQDFVSILDTKIEVHIKIFQSIFTNTTVHDRVRHRYHTLYLNAIWCIDLTAAAELGDGKNKNTGPNFLNIQDAATKKIVHFQIFPSNKEIKSKNPNASVKDGLVNTNAIIKEILKAVEKENYDGPLVLHSDSDNKQRTPDYYLILFQHGIIPSVNKTIYGPISNPHGNQSIEVFNKHIKQVYLVKIIENSKYKGQNMMLVSLSVKKQLYSKAIDLFHNTIHQTLSRLAFNHKQALQITPNQAYKSHLLFRELYCHYIAFKNNSQILPANKTKIENLDLTNVKYQKIFIDYVANYLFVNHVDQNNLGVIYDLLELKNGHLQNVSHNYVHDLVLIFFAYAVAKSKNKRLQHFFEPPYINDVLGETGPGRHGKPSVKFKNLLQTKEDFQTHSKIRSQLTVDVILKLHEFYVLFQQSSANMISTSLIFKKTDAQTEEIKEYLSDTVQAEIKRLNTTISDLKIQLDKFHLKDKLKEQAKVRRQHSKKRDLTPAIEVGHFMKALNLVKKDSNNTTTISKKFGYARNRLMLFFLYFSGFRVGMINQITVSDLHSVFMQNLSVPVTLSKTRQKTDERSFSIGDNVRNIFIFGKHNLWSDYKYVVSAFDNWGKANNISSEEVYNHSFFASFNDLSKPCSREATNKIVNSTIRKAATELKLSQKNILAFTSHSFRVHFITQFIHHYGIKKTQIQMGHVNIANTALYSRNSVPINQVNQLTDSLCFNKNNIKPHSDIQQFSVDQRELVANIIANQSNVNLNTAAPNFSFDDLKSEYTVSTSSSSNYCSDQFQEIEKECELLEAEHQVKLEKLKIDPTKAVKAKKHLVHKANASKNLKANVTAAV